MLTKNDIKAKYGDDIMFIFKGCEPFTEMNNAPAGVLIERDGKVVCFECGKWVNSIGTHCHAHNMTAREYKKKFGFNVSAGLCSKETSKRLSARPNVNRDSEHYKKTLGNFVKKNDPWNKGKKYKVGTIQRQNGTGNKGGLCIEQVKQRLSLVAAKFGNSFSETQARQVDWYLVEWAQKRFGSWNKMKDQLGYEKNHRHGKKEQANLIFDLREYVEDNGNLPFIRNGKNNDGFPHSYITYKNHFGSIKKAWEVVGIEKVRKINGINKFEWKLIY